MNRKIGITIGLVTLILMGIVFADILNYYGRIMATIIVSEAPKWIQTTYDDFNAGVKTNVVITNIEGGEVQLDNSLYGIFESQVFDSNSALTKWKKIDWDAYLPSETSLKFQIATNNDGATWNFLGPDGSSSTYYTTSDSDIWNGHDNTRYIKFKAFFETTDISKTPILKEVVIFYLSD